MLLGCKATNIQTQNPSIHPPAHTPTHPLTHRPPGNHRHQARLQASFNMESLVFLLQRLWCPSINETVAARVLALNLHGEPLGSLPGVEVLVCDYTIIYSISCRTLDWVVRPLLALEQSCIYVLCNVLDEYKTRDYCYHLASSLPPSPSWYNLRCC